MTTREDFDRAIRDDPGNRLLHMQYADWLEERGLPAGAEIQRQLAFLCDRDEIIALCRRLAVNVRKAGGFLPGLTGSQIDSLTAVLSPAWMERTPTVQLDLEEYRDDQSG